MHSEACIMAVGFFFLQSSRLGCLHYCMYITAIINSSKEDSHLHC